jgi:hypothetical protein
MAKTSAISSLVWVESFAGGAGRKCVNTAAVDMLYFACCLPFK